MTAPHTPEREENRKFPILQPKRDGHKEFIPWVTIATHEKQAQKNHGQTLDRLAERGGLSWDEALAVLRDQRWEAVKERGEDAKSAVLRIVKTRSQPSPASPHNIPNAKEYDPCKRNELAGYDMGWNACREAMLSASASPENGVDGMVLVPINILKWADSTLVIEPYEWGDNKDCDAHERLRDLIKAAAPQQGGSNGK